MMVLLFVLCERKQECWLFVWLRFFCPTLSFDLLFLPLVLHLCLNFSLDLMSMRSEGCEIN